MAARYGVVIVSAGVPEWQYFTVGCYRSLGIATRIDYDLCIVDNGGQGRGQVNFNTMLPYAEAVNAGAATLSNERLVILNNDITFRGDLFAKLEEFDCDYGGAVSLIKEGVEYIEGWCIVIKNKIWQALGGFDINYRNSWEDVDLAWRLNHEMGIHPVVIPIPCHHIWGATRSRYPGSNKWDEINRQRLLSRIRGEDVNPK